jgi:hypothetical protein
MSRSPKKRRPYDDPEVNKLALIIGHICIHWSRIEDTLDFAIGRLAYLEEGNITHAFTSNLDIRNKIQTLKALGFERKTNNEWFKELSEQLDYIDNVIRPERNKYVHSHWQLPNGKLTRISRRIRFKKTQAFKELTLTTEERARISLRDAQRFCAKMEKCFINLFGVCVWPESDGGPTLPPRPDAISRLREALETHPTYDD